MAHADPTGSAVAVTGLGALTTGGEGIQALWRVCAEGGGLFRPIEHFDVSRTGTRIAGFVPTADGTPRPGTDQRLPYLLNRAVGAALADAQARTGRGGVRTALVVASTDSGGCPSASAWRSWADGRSRDCHAQWAPPEGEAAAPWFDGPVLPIGNASAAGAAALGVGADLIRGGIVERAVVCGVDTITETAFQGLASLRTLSPSGCRPFSTRRSGIRISECAAAVVLDGAADPAAAHARLCGWGSSNEAGQAARPDAEGVTKAVTRALADAGARPEELGYVNAHAAGTRHGDAAELTALENILGHQLARIPIASSKAALGHCQGAAGTVEAIMTVLTLARGEVLPTLDLVDLDPRWAHLDFGLTRRAAAPAPELGMTISCGLGGSNVAVVFGRAAA